MVQKLLALLPVILLLVSLTPSESFAQTDGNPDLQKDPDSPRSPLSENEILSKIKSPKIDSKIMKVFGAKNPKDMATRLGTTFDNEKIAVYINLYPNQKIEGIKILGRDQDTVVAKLTLDEITKFSTLDSVNSITLPIRFKPHVVSEGVDFSFADLLHAKGITGEGVKVAIIDDSFFITDPKIQGNIISSTLYDSEGLCGGNISCGMSPGESHGTAVAQIVVDMAPEVDLRLYAIGNSVDFNNAVDDAIANNAKIITLSGGFPLDGGDGTTKAFRDGTSVVAKKINQAKTAGIFSTISSGNEGESHWKGRYVTSTVTPSSIGLSHQSLMNFRPTASGAQKACLPVNDVGDLFIATWNAWKVTTQDYDFYLYDSTMTIFLGGSEAPQNPLNLEPLELFLGVSNGNACLVLASWSSTQNHNFHIYTLSNEIDPALKMRTGSISTPADATGAMAVGAINYSTDTLESFSSAGPTDDNRPKPEICGPDGTSSDQSGLDPFSGTSASAPHVAGAAALLREQNPSITPDQLKLKLITLARTNPSYSQNNLCGRGALSLQGLTAEVTIDPTTGPVGTTATVTGTEFVSNSLTTIKYNTLTLSTISTDAAGGFSKTITIPKSKAGANTITAIDAKTNSAANTFTVTPSITLSQTSGTVGSSVTVAGDGFASGSSTVIKYNGVTQKTVTSSSVGAFSTVLTIPASNAGTSTITALDAKGNTASSTYTVNSVITLSKTTGTVGTAITVSGSGFLASSSINIKYNGVNQATTTANSSGSFSNIALTIPASPAGPNIISASDSTNNAEATFTVAPTTSLSKISGPVGVTVTVTGSGFAPSASTTIKFNGITQTTVTSNSAGGFTATFKIPASTLGTFQILASNSGGSISAPFTITAASIETVNDLGLQLFEILLEIQTNLIDVLSKLAGIEDTTNDIKSRVDVLPGGPVAIEPTQVSTSFQTFFATSTDEVKTGEITIYNSDPTDNVTVFLRIYDDSDLSEFEIIVPPKDLRNFTFGLSGNGDHLDISASADNSISISGFYYGPVDVVPIFTP